MIGRVAGTTHYDQCFRSAVKPFILNDVPSRVQISLHPTNRGTLLMRNAHSPRITIEPEAKAYCRVLGGGGFL